MSRDLVWTLELRARLATLVAAGLTGSEIGVQLGKSRNAILGQCHRQGLALGMTERKRRLRNPPKRERAPRDPNAPRRRRFAPDHAVHRSRGWGERAFTDSEIAVAIAARLAGQSRPKAARMIGASAQSLAKNWEKDERLMDLGRALFEQARAEAAERAAIARELAAFAAETKRLTMERTNAPILAQMSWRDRSIVERRIAGQTLQEIGEAFGITRERVRQIECRWRAQGLVVPGDRVLSDAARAKFAPRPRQRAPRMDFWQQARALSHKPTGRAAYNISDEERARRAEHMRRVSRERWDARS